MKISQVDETATLIYHAFEREDINLTTEIRELSFTTDLYIMMESNDKLLLFTPEEDSTLPVFTYKNEIPVLKESLISNNSDTYSFKFTTNFENYDTLAYVKMLKSGETPAYLYIFTPLYPVNTTVSILKDQLIIVTVIALFLAFALAIFLSERLSTPLTKITKSAKKMGKGDYNVTFDTHSSYTEINNLSNTLNRAALELGRADNLQKDLIANVSHDLKTPLTIIRSYAEKIRDLSGENKEKRDKDLDVIINETEKMTTLVSDMSTLSQMQNMKTELNITSFDISQVIKTIMASYEILSENEGYDITVTLPKECIINADAMKMKQVIQNLISNAVKYCGQSKKIIVKLKKFNKYIRFDVIDKGQGISEEDLPHVWDRYYRASKNYQRQEEGSGLGLSIVKEILTLHNADFGVESEIGKGSDFWFEMEYEK